MRRRRISLCVLSATWILLASAPSPCENHGSIRPDYRKWLDEDVRWIITQSERAEFLRLTSDEARDEFVADFWKRRNPSPGTPNPFKEEHYRRLAFSNEHFAAKGPGWESDRGRIYILYGPPDLLDSRPSTTTRRATEVWTFRNWHGENKEVSLRFVDECSCGDYRLLSTVPGEEQN